MAVQIHTSNKGIALESTHLYYQPNYFASQQYNQFLAYSMNELFVAIDIIENKAISMPRSPFGSILCPPGSESSLQTFINEVSTDLKRRNIRELVLHQPSEIYANYPDPATLQKLGFELQYDDSNQHITLSDGWQDQMHTMQKRKLKSLKDDGFRFRRMESDELEVAHQFLTVCRQTQGLQINISWDQLMQLQKNLPDRYECFCVSRKDKISALCISVNVTEQTAYYYLPGTSPMFRNQSPMVLLIAGMVDYYHKKGFKYLDLGVSSYEGKTQETLKIFKERMGGISTLKPTLKLLL